MSLHRAVAGGQNLHFIIRSRLLLDGRAALNIDVMRVVCRQGFTIDLAVKFLESLARHATRLAAHPFPLPGVETALSFRD